MTPVEIVVITLASLLVLWTAGLALYRKKKGRRCCGKCGDCPYRCKGAKDDKTPESENRRDDENRGE